MANILADSVSRLRAAGLYHDLDFKDGKQEIRTLFEPLTPVEQSTHTPIEVHQFFIKPEHRKPHLKLRDTKHLTSHTARRIQTVPR